MDLVKRGRSKVKEGDCVSIKSNYFDKEFEKYMHELGFADSIIYGRVTEVKDRNRDFTVTWDIDGQVSKHMTLEKVKLESRDTLKQIVESSVITTYDFQTAEQCSSKTAALTHALLIEDFDVANENGSYYLLANNKKCFKTTMYSTEPGALVYNKELLDSEGKFQIDEVLDDDWEGFDEDLHCEGSFLAWEMDQTLLQEEEKTDGASKKQLTKKKFELKIMPKHQVIV